MRILRIIWYLIEITIAVAIFIMLAQKTALFDRVIPWRSSGFPPIQTQTGSTTNNSGNQTPTQIPTTISSAPIHLAVSMGQSCTSPRWETIAENQSVTAYSSSISDISNTCLSELRVCRKWKLSGSYRYQTCDFFVDWKRNGIDLIPGASNSEQRFSNKSELVQAYMRNNKEYLQPAPLKDRSGLSPKDLSHTMQNSNIQYISAKTDLLDQETLQDKEPQHSVWSCTTPRWESVAHGKVVYAYDIANSTLHQFCKSEKRACINGKLTGTFQYKSCDTWVSQKEKTSDTLQSLAWTENNRLSQQQRVIENQGTLSPWWPQAQRSLKDQINDSVKLTSDYSTTNSNSYTSSWTWWTTINNTTTNSPSLPSNNTQNYIEFGKSCTSPRGTPIDNSDFVVAYRNSAPESNSLCNSEKRFCRNWRLWWSYTYQSCGTQPTPSPGASQNPTIREHTANLIENGVDFTARTINESVNWWIWATNDTINRLSWAFNTIWNWFNSL